MPALENGAEPIDCLPEEAGGRVSSETATVLVGESEAAAEARWSALSDAEVDSEIAAFRQGIRDISTELQSLGVAVSADEVQPPPLAGQEDAKVSVQPGAFRLSTADALKRATEEKTVHTDFNCAMRITRAMCCTEEKATGGSFHLYLTPATFQGMMMEGVMLLEPLHAGG